MDPNGKSGSREGPPLDYPPSAAIRRGPGTHMQHAFFQGLHQGPDVIPSDFILSEKADPILNANAPAQAAADNATTKSVRNLRFTFMFFPGLTKCAQW
jgi:glucose-6-phosphate isomerase